MKTPTRKRIRKKRNKAFIEKMRASPLPGFIAARIRAVIRSCPCGAELIWTGKPGECTHPEEPKHWSPWG
jgi:hypothetical protein